MAELCPAEVANAPRHNSFDIATLRAEEEQGKQNSGSDQASEISLGCTRNNERTLDEELRDCAKANRQVGLYPPRYGATAGLLSCPDLQRGHRTAESPYSSGWPSPRMDRIHPRRLSRSQPQTPPLSLRNRLGKRFRRRRPWEAPVSSVKGTASPIDLAQTAKLKTLRRRGPKATQIYTSSDDESFSGTNASEMLDQGVKPLAMVGVMAAIEDLDRLTAQAKKATVGVDDK